VVGRVVGTQVDDAPVECCDHRCVDGVGLEEGVVPRLVVDHEDVAPGATLALAAYHPDTVEVLDRARHRGRAHTERLADLGGRHPPVLVDHDGGEDPGREAGEARARQSGAEPLDEGGSLRGGRHVTHSNEFRNY
jgi:hypothetical protein